MQFVEELIHHQYGKLVLGGLRVEHAVANAEHPGLVHLAHQENWSGNLGHAVANGPLCEHLHALQFQLVLLQLRAVVGAYGDRRGA